MRKVDYIQPLSEAKGQEEDYIASMLGGDYFKTDDGRTIMLSQCKNEKGDWVPCLNEVIFVDANQEEQKVELKDISCENPLNNVIGKIAEILQEQSERLFALEDKERERRVKSLVDEYWKNKEKEKYEAKGKEE